MFNHMIEKDDVKKSLLRGIIKHIGKKKRGR
jgi:hypothetical protein